MATRLNLERANLSVALERAEVERARAMLQRLVQLFGPAACDFYFFVWLCLATALVGASAVCSGLAKQTDRVTVSAAKVVAGMMDSFGVPLVKNVVNAAAKIDQRKVKAGLQHFHMAFSSVSAADPVFQTVAAMAVFALAPELAALQRKRDRVRHAPTEEEKGEEKSSALKGLLSKTKSAYEAGKTKWKKLRASQGMRSGATGSKAMNDAERLGQAFAEKCVLEVVTGRLSIDFIKASLRQGKSVSTQQLEVWVCAATSRGAFWDSVQKKVRLRRMETERKRQRKSHQHSFICTCM